MMNRRAKLDLDKMQIKDRRTFIKTSTMFMGGALFSNIPLAGAYAAGEDTIKIALIGCGSRGTGAAVQALSTPYKVKLVAMADAFKDRLENSYKILSDKFGKDKVKVPEDQKFTGFDAYKHAIDAADVVLLTTPPGFRPIHFQEAVDKNKHVFMEKPVATDSPGVRKILAAAEEANRKKLNVVVGLQRRYQKSYREVINKLQSGAIGNIVSGQLYYHSGTLRVHKRQPGETEMEYQMRNWYYFNWLSGDHIVEQHIHNIDFANWLKGSYPITAQGTGSRFLRTGKDYGEIFDNHNVEYIYEDGAVFQSTCRHYDGCHYRIDDTFQGTKGSAYMTPANLVKLLDYKGNIIYNRNGQNDPNPYQVEHNEFFSAIHAGQHRFADAEHAAKSTMTTILGRYATYSGNVIRWDEVLNSEINLQPDNYAWSAKPKVLPDERGFYPFASPGKTKVI